MNRRWLSRVLSALVLGATSSSAPTAQAQEIATTQSRAPRHQLSLEVVPLAGALGYAFRVSPNTSLGIRAGFGMDASTFIPVSGRHFAEESWWAYEERDGATDKEFLGVFEASLFTRHFLARGFHLEGGLRTVGGMHFDSSDDDTAGATFSGGYAAVYWGGSILSVGARISGGYFDERATSSHEFGMIVNPIILKLTTR